MKDRSERRWAVFCNEKARATTATTTRRASFYKARRKFLHARTDYDAHRAVSGLVHGVPLMIFNITWPSDLVVSTGTGFLLLIAAFECLMILLLSLGSILSMASEVQPWRSFGRTRFSGSVKRRLRRLSPGAKSLYMSLGNCSVWKTKDSCQY